jgi:hypothetical protein
MNMPPGCHAIVSYRLTAIPTSRLPALDFQRRLLMMSRKTWRRNRMTLELADRVALITGAGQGIGRASALALAEAGAHVIVADIAGPQAEATSEAIMSPQRRALAVQADVGDLGTLIVWSSKPWRHSGRSTSL